MKSSKLGFRGRNLFHWLSDPYQLQLNISSYCGSQIASDISIPITHFNRMFGDIVRIPTIILCVVTIWKIPIENPILRRLYEHLRYVIRIVFVYLPNILQMIHLSKVNDFRVSNYLILENWKQHSKAAFYRHFQKICPLPLHTQMFVSSYFWSVAIGICSQNSPKEWNHLNIYHEKWKSKGELLIRNRFER